MKKIFRVIGKVLLWILYLAITGKERQAHAHAKLRDRECLGVENDMFGSTYAMGKHLNGKEPYRSFMNWKEFRQQHKF